MLIGHLRCSVYEIKMLFSVEPELGLTLLLGCNSKPLGFVREIIEKISKILEIVHTISQTRA